MRSIYQIYVEEQLIDIDPKTVIAVTLQSFDLISGDLVSRKASFTNQIKIPITKTNIAIFEFANNPKSGSNFPYETKAITIYCNGILLMSGTVIVKSIDSFINIQIYESIKNLSMRIANLYLSDLDFGDSPITWNQAFMDTKRASTSGWCSPLINYGQLDERLANTSISNYNLPSIAYKDVLTTILSNAGYTISGDFYDNNALFNKMIITYGRETWYGTSMKLNQALSTSILQSDFLRDFLIKFGAFFKLTNTNIEIMILESILSNTGNSIDWTLKRIKNKKDIIQYTWTPFSQLNNFLYPPIEIIPPSLPYNPNVNSSITVPNDNLNSSTDIYTSIFERPNVVTNSRRLQVMTLNLNNVAASYIINAITNEIYTTLPSSFTFDKTPRPMLGVLRTLTPSEAGGLGVSVLYNGNLRNDYLVGDFADYQSDSDNHDFLSFRSLFHGDGLLDTYYNSLQAILTTGTIATTHEYLLNDIDINSLDLFVPIFDDGNYYLINKIISYVSGKTTRVELLKI